MNNRSVAHDVKTAIQRAKHKISSLENELYFKRESCSESEEEQHSTSWRHKQELKDSLVDMYTANPKVNEELKQRLPSPVKRHCSETTPQPGIFDQGFSSDTSRSTLETDVLEKKLKELNTPRLRQGPPPPPPPLPAPVRSMEDATAFQTTPTEQELNIEKVDTKTSDRPQFTTPEPTAAKNTVEDHGNSKVCLDSRRQVPFLDKEKTIAFLLKELDSLRDLNKKLQDKLALKEKELETMRLDSQLQEEKLEAHACERAAALVAEIYKAQRERDQAVMARLRLANEERDEALLRAKKLQETALELGNMNPEESDMELEELLNRVSSADSALSIEHIGIAIMEHIQRARERRSTITCEEMKAVKEEKDSALTKCKCLEQELLHYREPGQTSSIYYSTTSSYQELAQKIQMDLEAVKIEKDGAVELCHRLEEELQALRKYHSDQKKQSCDSSRKVTPNPTVQSQSLLSRMQQLNSELQTTQSQLHLAKECEREAIEKVHKLERLVEVLRKKVGTGSVRTVI